MGLRATHFASVFANYESIDSDTYNVIPDGGSDAITGAPTQKVEGHHLNFGARVREELQFNSAWSGSAGLGIEKTKLDARQISFSYPTATPILTRIGAQRSFTNVAPDVALSYQPSADWRLRSRAAAGYGTPQIGNLFITPQGVPGNNTRLKSQKNIGLDLGAEWSPAATLKTSVTVFYERFTNELVTQSPGGNLQNFTFNAPRSLHRGVEIAADWLPLPVLLPGAKLTLSYLRNDQFYTDYDERLSFGTASTLFDRNGKRIPGVAPQYLHARLAYEQPAGALRGVGGFIEADARAAYHLDNANEVRVPGYGLVNFNLHYDRDVRGIYVENVLFFVEVRNVFNRTYVASAGNIADSINAAGVQNSAEILEAATGSIWAGAPRACNGGVRLKF
jgi:iron complex outermembrane receptor protein